MQVVPLSEILGAEVVDLDVTRPFTAEEEAELRQLFCQYHLLLIRGQDVTAEDQNRLVGSFGPIHVSQATGGLAAYVTNGDNRVIGIGTNELLWHNDGTYGQHPNIATSLWAEDVERGCVPTHFTNAIRVLQHLPEDLRTRIESLDALHLKDTRVELTNVPWRTVEKEPGTEPGRYATYVHPIVYQPPHLDEKTILINDLQTDHVIGLSPDESEALLQEVFSYLYAPEAVYSHEWEPNDIIIWDNIALQHCRPDNMGTVRHHLRRQSIDGWNLGNGDVMEWHDTAVYDSRIVAQAEG